MEGVPRRDGRARNRAAWVSSSRRKVGGGPGRVADPDRAFDQAVDGAELAQLCRVLRGALHRIAGRAGIRAVCDALYAKLLAEGRVKARPKKRSTTRAVHARRLGPDGREMPCRPYSYDTAWCHHTHAEDDPLIGQPIITEARPARGRECRRGGATEALTRPGAQDRRQHPSHASPGLGGFRGLGMGQAECRQRRASSAGAAKGRKVWTVAQLQGSLHAHGLTGSSRCGCSKPPRHAALRAGGRPP